MMLVETRLNFLWIDWKKKAISKHRTRRQLQWGARSTTTRSVVFARTVNATMRMPFFSATCATWPSTKNAMAFLTFRRANGSADAVFNRPRGPSTAFCVPIAAGRSKRPWTAGGAMSCAPFGFRKFTSLILYFSSLSTTSVIFLRLAGS